ncbi:MAG TPA: adenylate/guanylate cyclase domain-containing protein [Anaerolineae bacterium]|nr:adenylate/guanylate cyclase domain-containing protein [Anaerolineae bacterium]
MDTMEQIQKAMSAIAALRGQLDADTVEVVLAALQRQHHALEAAPSAAAPQRRQITSLFADLVDFTALSESLDPEMATEMLNALWAELDTVIVAHGGFIDKHMGDGVMALWGVAQTREDDAERAVRAALALQAALREFNVKMRRNLPPLHLRVGLNTGLALLGQIGTTGEFSAIGDTINLASRLEDAAPVDGVLVSQDTYHQVWGLFDLQPQSPLTVKGRHEPVQTYLVQRVQPRSFWSRTRGIEGVETPMVGRAAELETLQTAFRAAATPHLITIVGDAGVGKSRLLYEFESWLDALPQSITYLRGRATPEMQLIPYGLFRDMFSFRFGIRESDSPALALEKFRTGMAGVLEPEQADLIGQHVGFDFEQAGSPVVRALLGSTSFGQLAQNALRTFMRAVTQRPTVLFWEDIHWADERSLDLLLRLLSELPAAALLVVCLARPTFFERCPTWGSAISGVTCERLVLKPLTPADSSALVRHLLHQVAVIPPPLLDLIVESAEGNPFYVEELIKMLIDDGAIIPRPGQWEVVATHLKSLRVPRTLTGVLQARLDALPPAERQVLQCAAVVGRTHWDATVLSLLQASPDTDDIAFEEVQALLKAACQRELIFQRPRSAFQGTEEYSFKHAILRDVTYETVLLKSRRIYHGQAARWLEAHAGERVGEYLNLIAGHYELAGEYVQAATYLLRSGENAYAVSAYRDAVAAFERALALLAGATEAVSLRATLQVRLGYALRQLSDYPTALAYLEQALALAPGDSALEVAALTGLGWALMGQGNYDAALQYLEPALAAARQSDNQRGVALALWHLADVAYRQGMSDTAAHYAWECLSLYRALGDRQGIAGAFRVLGFVSHMRGDYDAALQYHEESRRMYWELGDRWGVGTGFINLGEAARKLGRFAEAADYYAQSLPYFHEIGNRVGAAIATLNLGHVHLGLGDVAAARGYFREAVVQAQELGALAVLIEGVVGLAELYAHPETAAIAAGWLGWAQAHPAFNAEIAQFTDALAELLRACLGEASFAEALTQGVARTSDEIVKQVLGLL